ncbi:unnamed protein product [Zymoseptoria tritici ST99CH_1A5]|uniref:Tat pathway signal sequence n=3 Tax=Zymoseptoria tritici TaxID=1047171 RepID=A0A1X7RYA7_ZYMT9|nr:unnamed protein product [Zymoseptoria tritici ST99CH_3D7]SMR55202.1 unnamed protein product [Zymoseptoria tritici ST99CH_1E4]SMR57577.1 unnamed protein product [Zymoseptoria tritici ST99CH_3D1]SMY26013.1 unnamed protein product [Zymoseptoria tritici ST99CH_1A5]
MSRYSDYRKVESQFSDSRSSVENAEDEIYSFPQKPALSFSRLSFVLLILLVTFLSSGSTAVALGARPWRLWHMKPDFPLWTGLSADELQSEPLHTEYFSHWKVGENKYTQHPSKGDVDREWEELGIANNFFVLPEHRGVELGLDKHRHVMMTDEQTKEYGVSGFITYVDGMHQLHCLDAVRKALWYNRGWYEEHKHNNATLDLQISHTNHCLNIVRERMMCTADRGLVPWVHLSDKKHIIPDFNRPHQCRNWDVLSQWATAHQFTATEVSELVFTPRPGVMTYDVKFFE